MSRARKVYEMIREQLRQRGLVRAKYLRLATLPPRRLTKEETDEFFGQEKKKR
jgi:hypothetical protein